MADEWADSRVVSMAVLMVASTVVQLEAASVAQKAAASADVKADQMEAAWVALMADK